MSDPSCRCPCTCGHSGTCEWCRPPPVQGEMLSEEAWLRATVTELTAMLDRRQSENEALRTKLEDAEMRETQWRVDYQCEASLRSAAEARCAELEAELAEAQRLGVFYIDKQVERIHALRAERDALVKWAQKVLYFLKATRLRFDGSPDKAFIRLEAIELLDEAPASIREQAPTCRACKGTGLRGFGVPGYGPCPTCQAPEVK